MLKNCWLILLTVLGGFAAAPSASAADRTVCFEIRIRDTRTRCPTAAAAEVGAKRECHTHVNAVDGDKSQIEGFRYELWDADGLDPADDDLISTFLLGGTGRRCATFEWEAISGGEANPDVYVKLLNQVRATGTSEIVLGKKGDDTDYSTTTWRDIAQFDNCTTGSECDIAGVLVPTPDPTTNKSLMIMALDSAERTLDTYEASMEPLGTIVMKVDVDSAFPSSCPTACAWDRLEIRVPTDTGTGANHGDRVSHEVGHVLQMREFIDDALNNDCTNGTTTWTLTSVEHDSCVTQEGWATYVAMTSWYDPQVATAPKYAGTNLEDASMLGGAATCTAAEELPGQGAKAFWDIDDDTNELGVAPALGDDDTADFTTDEILDKWEDAFPHGTNDREDQESGINGVNLWDYRFSGPLANEETLLEHNCMGPQEFN